MSDTEEMDAAAATSTLTYREALRSALREELERDDAVFLMGEEIGVFWGRAQDHRGTPG